MDQWWLPIEPLRTSSSIPACALLAQIYILCIWASGEPGDWGLGKRNSGETDPALVTLFPGSVCLISLILGLSLFLRNYPLLQITRSKSQSH